MPLEVTLKIQQTPLPFKFLHLDRPKNAITSSYKPFQGQKGTKTSLRDDLFEAIMCSK